MIAIKGFNLSRKGKYHNDSKRSGMNKKSKYSIQFLMLVIIGNLILLFFIVIENKVFKSRSSPWIYVKDFFTLNLALFAIVKDKIIRYKIYAFLVNSEGRPKERLDGICEYTVFLNSIGEQPYFVKMSNVDILLDDVPAADYICEINSSPEMDGNNAVHSLPLYLNIRIGNVFLNGSQNYTGKICGDFLFQFSQTTEEFKVCFPVICKLGEERVDLR